MLYSVAQSLVQTTILDCYFALQAAAWVMWLKIVSFFLLIRQPKRILRGVTDACVWGLVSVGWVIRVVHITSSRHQAHLKGGSSHRATDPQEQREKQSSMLSHKRGTGVLFCPFWSPHRPLSLSKSPHLLLDWWKKLHCQVYFDIIHHISDQLQLIFLYHAVKKKNNATDIAAVFDLNFVSFSFISVTVFLFWKSKFICLCSVSLKYVCKKCKTFCSKNRFPSP